jgi:hypothetical protein
MIYLQLCIGLGRLVLQSLPNLGQCTDAVNYDIRLLYILKQVARHIPLSISKGFNMISRSFKNNKFTTLTKSKPSRACIFFTREAAIAVDRVLREDEIS